MSAVGDEAGTRGATRTQWLELIVAWTIVGAPALWGVAQVVEKSLALFR